MRQICCINTHALASPQRRYLEGDADGAIVISTGLSPS